MTISTSFFKQHKYLTHWGRVTHICVCKLTIIGSDNGLSPEWHQAIMNQCWNIVKWTLRNKLQWNFKRNWYIFLQENVFEKSSRNWRPFCLGLHVLIPLLVPVRGPSEDTPPQVSCNLLLWWLQPCWRNNSLPGASFYYKGLIWDQGTEVIISHSLHGKLLLIHVLTSIAICLNCKPPLKLWHVWITTLDIFMRLCLLTYVIYSMLF